MEADTHLNGLLHALTKAELAAMTPDDVDALLLEVANRVVRTTANAIRERRRAGTVDTVTLEKAPGDKQFDADLAFETVGLTELRRYVAPDACRVVAEEGTARSPEVLGDAGAPLIFVFDPCDGSTSYERGLPDVAVAAGFVDANRGNAGIARVVAVAAPFYQKLDHDAGDYPVWTAIGGRGAFASNGSRLTVSSDGGNLVLGIGFNFRDPAGLASDGAKVLQTVIDAGASDVRRIGPAALDLVRVASGTIHGHVELRLGGVWDRIAALLVTEAGGKVEFVGQNGVVAGSPPLVERLMGLLRRNGLLAGGGASAVSGPGDRLL